ncbi:peptidoglycan-binding domain-containing protein [Cellulomonas flavigena]|uniref:peptidoglycan-binding domain-containing protein n=1 Tax=Cellulomonas flavigena TaxID=1711 RepID=UPI0002E8E789|nr:peptidoglycan-binding domain-containing protein [Cellulomonas flavigena]
MSAVFALSVVVPVAVAPAAHAATPQCETADYAWSERPDYGWNVHRPYMPMTNTTVYFVRCNLQYGSRGPGVKALQAAINECHRATLNAAGLALLSVDGDFGAKTRTAVKAVQRSLGITVDGVYGPTTNHYMKWPGPWEGGYNGPRCLAG